MDRRTQLLALFFIAFVAPHPQELPAQTTPTVALRDNTPGVHALTNARIVAAPGSIVQRGTVVIRDGLIEALGSDVPLPADARVWNLEGRTLYPGFIDAHSDVGMREAPADLADADDRGPTYWNPQVRSFFDAASGFSEDPERTGELRSQGVTVALATPQLGIFRGNAALLSLGDGPISERVLRSGVAQSLSFTRDDEISTRYPTSLMGAIAIIRQALYNAEWYLRAHAAYRSDPTGRRRPETNAALSALGAAARGEEPILVEARNDEELLRALRIAEEFPLVLWVRGSGHEYRVRSSVR